MLSKLILVQSLNGADATIKNIQAFNTVKLLMGLIGKIDPT